MNGDIIEYRLKGYCCSQIIMAMGLNKLEKENPDLIAVMAGLCNGLWMEKTCGILSAAVCLLFLADSENAGPRVAELYEWFEDAYGSLDCNVLMEENPMNKVERCPAMLETTFDKVCNMMDWD